jgi:hypothetical protein
VCSSDLAFVRVFETGATNFSGAKMGNPVNCSWLKDG